MKMMTLEQIASACPDLKWKIERAKLFQYWGQYLKGEISGPDSDIGTRNLFVTGFKDETAQTLRTGEPSLMALRDHILATDAPTKTETPWLKLAKFGSKRTENNCLRHDANVIEISGVECDYDDEMISFDDAVEIMRKAGMCDQRRGHDKDRRRSEVRKSQKPKGGHDTGKHATVETIAKTTPPVPIWDRPFLRRG